VAHNKGLVLRQTLTTLAVLGLGQEHVTAMARVHLV
jgi:hypothetical protein